MPSLFFFSGGYGALAWWLFWIFCLALCGGKKANVPPKEGAHC
jgi:hypothetical protein